MDGFRKRLSKKKISWLCQCECGRKSYIPQSNLVNETSLKCRACASPKNTFKSHILKFGRAKHPLYSTYSSMKDRCYRKKNKNFILYGGRGIKVCDRWLESFESFLEDMGEKPSRFHSLDRINVNGNYEPSNCKWSTQKEQCVNRRTVKNLEKEIIILKKHIEIKNKIIDAYITRLEKA